MVVGTHHKEAVLGRDRDHERPKNERKNAERGLRREPAANGVDDGLQRVQRAGPEIAINDAQRGERRRGRGWRYDAGRGRMYPWQWQRAALFWPSSGGGKDSMGRAMQPQRVMPVQAVNLFEWRVSAGPNPKSQVSAHVERVSGSLWPNR